MSLDLARTRAALTREIEAIEGLLQGDAHWLRYRALEARLKQHPKPGQNASMLLPQEVRDALNRNPLFAARAGLLEALSNLSSTTDEPEGATAKSIGGPQADVPQAEFQFDLPAAPASEAQPSPKERVDAALSALAARARSLPAPDRSPTRSPLATSTRSNGSPTRIPIVDESNDDLRHIAFIDGEIAAKLNASGIVKFSDVAHLTVDQVAMISVRFGLGNRVSREQWIEQAAILATGQSTAYARQVQVAELGAPKASSEEIAAPVQANEISDPPPGSSPAARHESPQAKSEASPLRPSVPLAEPDIEELLDPAVPPLPTAPLKPPPIPEQSTRLAPPIPHDELAGMAEDDDALDAQVRICVAGSVRNGSRASTSAGETPRSVHRARSREDRMFPRNPPHWDMVEEAAVEIVPRSSQIPFPGVGPVEEAARRLQFAAEAPASSLSGILRALRRR